MKCSTCDDPISIVESIKLIIHGKVHYFCCEGCLFTFIIERNEMSILDEPISKRLYGGYRTCSFCGKYENHPTLTRCVKCNKPLYYEKDMTWREYLKMEAKWGRGPIWTLLGFLCDEAKIEWADVFLGLKQLPDEQLKIYKEAVEIHKQYENRK